jgi:RNA polymerase sigma factor (sigma-70 family)
MNLLEIPYTTSRHNDWIVMAKNLGAGHYSEDIVQEMYIKLSQIKNPERLIDKENPNQIVGFYVYTIIRSLIVDLQRIQKRTQMVSIESIRALKASEIDLEFETEFTKKLDAVEQAKDQMNWYDLKLFELYHNEGLSIRKLSKETRISASSIFNTLRNAKIEIHEAYDKAKKSTK